jgi:hypothetical protein
MVRKNDVGSNWHKWRYVWEFQDSLADFKDTIKSGDMPINGSLSREIMELILVGLKRLGKGTIQRYARKYSNRMIRGCRCKSPH